MINEWWLGGLKSLLRPLIAWNGALMKSPPTFLNIRIKTFACNIFLPCDWMDLQTRYELFTRMIRIQSQQADRKWYWQKLLFFCLFFWHVWAKVTSPCAENVPRVSELLYIFIASCLLSAGGVEKRALLQKLRRAAVQNQDVCQNPRRLNPRLRPAKPTRRCAFLAVDSLIYAPLITITLHIHISLYIISFTPRDLLFHKIIAFINSRGIWYKTSSSCINPYFHQRRVSSRNFHCHYRVLLIIWWLFVRQKGMLANHIAGGGTCVKTNACEYSKTDGRKDSVSKRVAGEFPAERRASDT